MSLRSAMGQEMKHQQGNVWPEMKSPEGVVCINPSCLLVIRALDQCVPAAFLKSGTRWQ